MKKKITIINYKNCSFGNKNDPDNKKNVLGIICKITPLIAIFKEQIISIFKLILVFLKDF